MLAQLPDDELSNVGEMGKISVLDASEKSLSINALTMLETFSHRLLKQLLDDHSLKQYILLQNA